MREVARGRWWHTRLVFLESKCFSQQQIKLPAPSPINPKILDHVLIAKLSDTHYVARSRALG